MTNYLLLLISISLAVLGQILMKRGMQIFGSFPLSMLVYKIIPMILNPYVFFGLASFAISAIFWLVVLSRFPLSIAYPMVSLGYVIIAIVSFLLFKESITLVRWIGIALICLGVFLISR